MRLAQRLGIGRHVPCLLAFTDIGELQIDLLPVGGMSPDGIYRHVRNWVDDYYEINRERIERWDTVEKNIENLCARANQ